MSPAQDSRELFLDAKSRRWCHRMGLEAKASSKPYTRWDQVCPFRQGSPHRDAFHDGWRGRPL